MKSPTITVALRPLELDLICNGLQLLEADYVDPQSPRRERVHLLRLRLEELVRSEDYGL